jgi:hypothetical protein
LGSLTRCLNIPTIEIICVLFFKIKNWDSCLFLVPLCSRIRYFLLSLLFLSSSGFFLRIL